MHHNMFQTLQPKLAVLGTQNIVNLLKDVTSCISSVYILKVWLTTSMILTLRLHYVPGDHGSHGSPKGSAPCDLVNFCLGTQVLLSIITFRHGLSRYPLQTVG